MQYKPGDTARIGVVPTLNGVPQSGASLTITIYNRTTQTKVVNAQSMTEFTSAGVYYYDYLIPAGDVVYDVYIYRGSQLIKTVDLYVTASANGEYVPGDTIRFTTAVVQNGVPVTGLTLTLDVYDLYNHVKVVTAGAMTEVVGTGIYYRDFVSANADRTYLAVMFNATQAVHTTLTNTILTTTAPALSSRFTTIDIMVTRVGNTLKGFSVAASSTDERTLWINQAIEDMNRDFEILQDDFFYNISSGVNEYQVDANLPFPAEIKNVWYATGSAKVPLDYAPRDIVEADISNGNDTVYNYTIYRDSYKSIIALNSIPSANIPAGLIINGPYFPTYALYGQTPAEYLPLERRYDETMEWLVVAKGVEQYIPNPQMKDAVQKYVQFVLSSLRVS